ncbi:MotA/TolQ/ExbB proton channel family protein [Calothrix sp. UHCC 0171]|uniref:MotA/TolQ/ExbB proton channel family protein n=1 Tax=Calothrix sp. UHCC 0171 TaxID=3110245 RepID=UPI002B1EDEF3|nr:MotA/TolQ/ExbB proton channel family protein [Calothrix sp. UHCC 0171]MEA5574465.1 MotA/TolQ/ExbB proton channel family protein [Calothrix sp. UHCC 0171]
MTIKGLFVAGGIVMFPLFIFSVTSIALSAERIWFWWQVCRRQKPVIRDVLNLYRRGNHVSAIDKLQHNLDLPIARIFISALELEEPTPEEFRLALESEAQAEIPLLKRFNIIFETIIGLAPLLGLLGTVLGLITSFASLNIGDVGGTKTPGVTAGISEALVSTASGLIVAIFTLLFANSFRGFYITQIRLIQEYGGQLELLYRRYYEKASNSKIPQIRS